MHSVVSLQKLKKLRNRPNGGKDLHKGEDYLVDPELKGPDRVWECIKSGKGHVYYSLALLLILSWDCEHLWAAVAIGAIVGGVIGDLWAHEYLH